MSSFHILIADNDPDSLNLCAEYLSNKGYHVITASNPEDAQQLLLTERLHLAILDLRLRNDSDENDRTGLRLAKNLVRALPKIIWTKFPVHEDVREALKPDSYNLPPAVDFIDQRKGFKELALAIAESLEKHARFNWELEMSWEANQTSGQFAQMIVPNADIKNLPQRTLEFEDLLRKLFFSSAQIMIGKLLFYDKNRIILPVYSYGQDGFMAQFIVSVGLPAVIEQENQRYATAVPQPIRTSKIGYKTHVETANFVATAYTFIGGNLENTTLLNNYFERATADMLQAVVHDLFHQNLSIWYQQDRSRKSTRDFFEYQKQSLFNFITLENIEQKIQKICEQANKLGIVTLDISDNHFSMKVGNHDAERFANPLQLVQNGTLSDNHLVDWGHIHGCVDRNTILVDTQQKTWLINFLQAGEGPLVHDFVMLESSIKFCLLQNNNLLDRLAVDNLFLEKDSYNHHQSPHFSAPELNIVVQMIQSIHEMAQKFAGCNWQVYQLGQYFAALYIVASFNNSQIHRIPLLLPYVHALCYASMLSTRLLKINFPTVPEPAMTGLWVDPVNKNVWVEGNLVELTIQEFRIIEYLHAHQGQLCERKGIVEGGLGEAYDPFDVEQSRLNSAMSRLRQKIEPDPKEPRYLHTIRGRGYQLRVN